MFKKIKKRDGKIVNFNADKIVDAISKAGLSTEEFKADRAKALAEKVLKRAEENIKVRTPSVEQIQDIVEEVLMESSFKRTAREYIRFRQERSRVREAKSDLMNIYKTISHADASEDSDVKRSNANVDGNSAMGKMLQFGAEGSKVFAKTLLLRPDIAAAHDNGDIHIHDLDFYATGTLTCCQSDPFVLFENGGFNTGHGHLRTPNSISSYAALAAILLQANQNEQHGGQSIPNFDYAMAPGVDNQTRKEYVRCAIRECAAKSNNPEEFRQIMKAEYDIKVHESRDRYSFTLPDRERGITERQLGTIYTKPFIEKVIGREEIYYDRDDGSVYWTNDYVPSIVKKLVDIASNEKAQVSKGYEHAILISNLKKTAETFNVLSEKSIKGMDELELSLRRIGNRYSEVTKELKGIEQRIADIKTVIQAKEDISRIGPVLQELKSGKQSAKFRKEHESDLIVYKAAREKLKQLNTELKSFSEEKLLKEISSLTESKNILYEQRSQMKKDMRDLENAKHNIKQLVSEEKPLEKMKGKTEPEIKAEKNRLI